MYLCLFIGILTAQITTFPWSENFDDETLPSGWSNNGWAFNEGAAYTWINSQMLITPQLQLPISPTGQGLFLSFHVRNRNSYGYFNDYQILVSTTGNNPASFTPIHSGVVISSYIWDPWAFRDVNLSQYEGETIYIAFQRAGWVSSEWLYLDNIEIKQMDILPTLITEFPWTNPWVLEVPTAPIASNWINGGWDISHNAVWTGNSNQLLITPQLQLPATTANQELFLTYAITNDYISFLYGDQLSVPAYYQILVSTTGNNAEDFTLEYSSSINSNDFTYRYLNISEYEGEAIYIGFQQIGETSEHPLLGLGYVEVKQVNPQPSLITEFPWYENFQVTPLASNWTTNGWTIGLGVADSAYNNSLLITPQLQLPSSPANQALFLTYSISGNATNGASIVGHQILVSTTGNNPEDFVLEHSSLIAASYGSYRSIGLSEYEGESIYIAFQGSSNDIIYLYNVEVKQASLQPSIITEYPWVENFDETPIASNLTNNGWTYNIGSNGNGYARNWYNNEMLITPQLLLPITSENEAMFLVYQVYDDSSIDILISTTGCNPVDFIIKSIGWSQTYLPSSWISHYVDLSEYEGEAIYIAFQSNREYYYETLDNIEVKQVNLQPNLITEFPWSEWFSGTAPIATNWINNGWVIGGISSITFTHNDNQLLITPQLQLPATPAGQAMFLTYSIRSGNSLYNSGSETVSYQVLVSTTGTSPEDFTNKYLDTAVTTSNNLRSVDLSEYEGESIYLAFQKAGGIGNLLLYSIEVKQLSSPPSLITEFPWSEGFGGSEPIARNWLNNGWVLSENNAHTQGNFQLLITPQLQLPTAPSNRAMFLTYNIWNYQESNPPVGYQVLVSTTGNNPEAFSPIYTGSISNNWLSESINLSQYEGDTIYIAFQRTGGDGDIYLDNVEVKQVEVPPPLITQFPWYQGFNSVNYPTGWTYEDWEFNGDFAYTEANDQLLITPQLQISASATEQAMYLTYAVRAENSNSVDYQILVSSTGYAPANFTSEYTGVADSAEWVFRTISLSPHESENIFIAFKRVGGVGYLQIDDVSVGRPSPPDNLVVVGGNNSVYLTWGVPLYTPHGYQVHRNGVAITGIIAATTYQDSTAINGNEYTYIVSAYYAEGLELESEPETVTLDNIQPAVNLVANVVLYDVILTWNASEIRGSNTRRASTITKGNNTRAFLGYNIYRGTTLLNTQPENITTYTDQNVSPGSYNYTVSAVYSNGESTPTDPVSVVVYNIQPPANLQATPEDSHTIILLWESPDATAGLQHYRVYRRVAAIDTFELFQDNISELTYADAGLESDVVYYYYVTAYFANGESLPSNVTSASPFVAFNPPQALVASIGFNSVTLSWSAPATYPGSATLTSYKIMRELLVLADNQATSIETFADSTALNGQAYTYSVVALYTDEAGESSPVSTFVQLKVFNAPVALTAISGNSQVILNWLEPEEHQHLATLTGYSLYREGIPLPNGTITNPSILTFTDTNVVNGTTYTYFVVANYTEPLGTSDLSNITSATPSAAFNPPQNLTATVGFNSVVLSWESPTTNPNVATLSGYKIMRDELVLAANHAIDSTTFTDNTAQNGQGYTYSVVALYTNPDGESTSLDAIVQMKVFNPPTNLSVNAGNQQVDLTWLAPALHTHQAVLTGYQVYRNDAQLLGGSITDPSTLAFIDSSVDNGTTYTYFVVASYTDPMGVSEPSNAGQATPSAVNNAPQNFSATIGFNSVYLSWETPNADPNAATLSGYRLMRGSTILVANHAIEDTFYTDNTAVNGLAYTYSVTALYTNPTSESYPTSTSVQLRVYNSPSELTSNAGNMQVTLSWLEPSSHIHLATLSGYRIYRDAALLPSGIITDVSTLTFADTSAENGTTYSYYVVANYTDPIGDSTPSNTVSATPYAVFNPPMSLSAIAGISQVTLNWQEPTPHPNLATLTGYKVYRGTTLLTAQPITELTFTDIDLPVGLYSYTVIAVYSNGESNPTMPLNVTIYSVQPPTNLQFTTPVPLTVVLTWQQPTSLSGLLHYNVYRRVGLIGDFSLLQGNIPNPFHTDSNLEVGLTYFYYVTAVFSNGESVPSNIVSSTQNAVFNPVSNLESTVGFNSVTLTWFAPAINPNSATLNGFRILRGGTFLATSDEANILTFTDATAINGQSYLYQVVALYINPIGESDPVSASVQMKVFNPVNNFAYNIGFNSVILNWVAPAVVTNSATFGGYKVMRGVDVLVANQSGTTYTDNTAVNGLAYTYSVTALYTNPVGDSAPASQSVQMKVFTAPTGLTASGVSSRVVLNWVTPVVNEHSADLAGYVVYCNGVSLVNGTINDPYQLTFTDNNVSTGLEYTYNVVARYINPIGYSEPSESAVTTVADFDEVAMPMVTSLGGNYPNPFNPSTVLRFTLASESLVSIDIYSLNGQLVRSLVNGVYGVGEHRVMWNGLSDSGRSVSSGVYFYRMRAGEYVGVRKMLLVK